MSSTIDLYAAGLHQVAALRGAPASVFQTPATTVWLRTADAVSAMEMSAQALAEEIGSSMGPQTLQVTMRFTNLPPGGLSFSQLIDVRQALARAATVPLAQVNRNPAPASLNRMWGGFS
jgi:hypothetical protein